MTRGPGPHPERLQRHVRTVAAPRCESCGNDHAIDDPQSGLICSHCRAAWPRYQVGP